MEIVPYSGELDLELPLPVDVKRQDSLYRDATMPAHAGHHGQVEIASCWVVSLVCSYSLIAGGGGLVESNTNLGSCIC
jgi:hypothetical protein